MSGERAVLGWEADRCLVGIGPFTMAKQPPVKGAAFYCNDFALSRSAPWLIPAAWKLERMESEPAPPRIEWQAPDSEVFATVFHEVSDHLQRGLFQKTVPAVAELGEFLRGDGSQLSGRLEAGSPLTYYGLLMGRRGFSGMTPEILFHLKGRRLRTMALAGTARADEWRVLMVDDKEIREHEFVTQALVSKLGDLGELRRGERGVLNLGSVVHLHTGLELELDHELPVDALIRRLHPTPALGPLPRTGETMELLLGWRRRLGVPEEFGAPFGAVLDGVARIHVMIRGLWWDGSRVILPAGCGLIEGSRLVNEWRELRLKRESVKALFRV